MPTIDLGAAVTVRLEVRHPDTDALTAATVALTVSAPDGTTSTPAVTTSSTGVYTATFAPTQVGRHGLRWTTSGAVTGATVDVLDVADPNALPLVGLDEIRRHMRLDAPTTTAQRAREAHLRALADTATELVEAYCDRAFSRRTVTETHPAGTVAILRRSPVLSVTSVTAGGQAVTGWALGVGGVLTGSWSGDATVVYVAGYPAPPEPVRLAVLRLVEHLWQRSQQAPHSAFGAQGGGTFDEAAPSAQTAMPYSVTSLLVPFTAPGIG